MARRIRIYLVGVGIGLILVYVLIIRRGERDFSFWFPQNKVAFAIQDDSVLVKAPRFSCMLACSGLDSAGLASFLRESEFEIIRRDPFEYTFRGENPAQEKLAMKFRKIKYNRFQWLSMKNGDAICECPE
ncbi:MAG: hypothetical protein ACFB10_07925 [Salibacteraceae bacterium]|mgnify:CR=1 FL=1